jgi:hypothetical protein
MQAKIIGREMRCVEIEPPAPKWLLQDGKFYEHCGVITPENIAVYRLKPFGGGRALARQPNQTRTKESLARLPYAGREW